MKIGGVAHFYAVENGVERYLHSCHNAILVTPSRGSDLITQVIAGLPGSSIEITHCGLGTGTAATDANTTSLQNEVVKELPKTRVTSRTATSISIDFFLPSGAVPNNTYREMGVWCGAFLFARIVLSPVLSKGSNQDFLVKYQFSISQ